MKKELKENIKSARILRNLLVTILLMLVIVALCVGLNILIDKLNIPDVDLTQEKLYSLSQESKDKIKSVNKDTKIILYNMDDVKDFAELYNRENSHITCEVLTDVTTRPDLETEYGIGQVNKELIIIENEDRKKALATSDLYTTDYTTYDTIDTTEQALTNAILDVNLESNPKIYFVTNHMAMVGMNFGVLLGGTVTMEAVFTLNGVGTLILTSIRSKDIPVVIGAIVILAVCYTLVMLVVDILYGFIDPQIKARYLKR